MKYEKVKIYLFPFCNPKSGLNSKFPKPSDFHAPANNQEMDDMIDAMIRLNGVRYSEAEVLIKNTNYTWQLSTVYLFGNLALD